ncbi:HD-GYP domain-containing protein [hot springs metagenome]|uniref:HD-GYP domain-containing protein n=1 Tax=hot springs metagenome TaxID=433727 RepID=A0A5J4L4F3_9ZZZZ
MVTKYREIDADSRITIDADRLIVGKRLPFNVFIKDKGIIKHLFNKGMVFTNISKEILKEKGISEVYISKEEDTTINNYLSKTADKKTSPYDDPVLFKQYSFHKEEHHQIDKSLLLPNTTINFSLFALDKFDIKTIVEASEKSPATINKSVLNITGDILIKKSDIPLYHDYLNSLLKETTLPDENRTKIKALAIKENSKIVIKDLLDDPRSGEKIKESNVLVNNMIDCLLENRDAIYSLLTLRGYDYYTYTHSVNVGALSISLGIAIDLKRDDIEKLGMGAILHDIGKSTISHEILNKQGKLNETEYRIMKNHVIEGEKLLRDHKEIPDESFDAVLQHHEKLTGKGYPFQLAGNNIKLFGRITAIADCYDALTTQRPYKPAFTPFYALSIISKETGDYDADLLKTFIKMLGKIR